MTNDQPPPETTPTPAPQEPPKPAPDLQRKARAQAEYMARNQEELDLTLQYLEQAGHVRTNQRIDALEREIALRDIIAEHGLTKEDIPFISANSRDEMQAKATALKARLASVAPTGAPQGPQKKVIPVGHMGMKPAEAIAQPPPISEIVRGRGAKPSLEAAEDALYKAMEGLTYEG